MQRASLLPGSFSFLFCAKEVDEVVLFFASSSLSLSLALEALIDAVRHLLLACLAGCLLILPSLPLPQVVLDPAMATCCSSKKHMW